MGMILSRYQNDNADLDKLDITLLKGIYKRDPYATVESDVSFEASSSSSLKSSEKKSSSSLFSVEYSKNNNEKNSLPTIHFIKEQSENRRKTKLIQN